MMRLLQLLPVLALASAWPIGTTSIEADCSQVTFSLQAVADNVIFNNSNSLPPDNGTALVDATTALFQGKGENRPIANVSVTGLYNISATYCQPRIGKSTTLQLLVHGATYNSTYWTGLGFKDNDYVRDAVGRGHSTLSIDRLGHGLSDHPDPISAVQLPLQVELLHAIITQLRCWKHGISRGLSQTRLINKLIYVGHSYGSFLGNSLSNKYPQDIDALILTGYSIRAGFPTPVEFNDFQTVDRVSGTDPINRHLPPGYLRATNSTGRQVAFYGKVGSFDVDLADFAFEHSDTAAIGELLTQGLTSTSRYPGPLLLASGDQDGVFCSPANGVCKDQLDQTRAWFPNVTKFDTYVAKNSGHCINLNHAAPQTFSALQDWIHNLNDSTGFRQESCNDCRSQRTNTVL